MIVTKGDLISGTYALMRISGLTVDPSPEDTTLALQIADDYAEELKGSGLDIGWQYPFEYGNSDPSDNSGVTTKIAGPFKKMLMREIVLAFGRETTQTLEMISGKGMRSLENILVNVPASQNPPTLSIGSGNEQSYSDRTFYSEPPINNDAYDGFKSDVYNYTEDFSQWLVDEELVTVTWSVESSGITIANETFTETEAAAELTFNETGGYTVCISATKTNSTALFTVQKNFVIKDCSGQNGFTN
ncbi:MAG: packaged DNA stabilization gp4 family protein [Oleispira sp.]